VAGTKFPINASWNQIWQRRRVKCVPSQALWDHYLHSRPGILARHRPSADERRVALFFVDTLWVKDPLSIIESQQLA